MTYTDVMWYSEVIVNVVLLGVMALPFIWLMTWGFQIEAQSKRQDRYTKNPY